MSSGYWVSLVKVSLGHFKEKIFRRVRSKNMPRPYYMFAVKFYKLINRVF